MPAIITHHVFGEEAVTALPEGLIDGQEELLAFLLGNQGPDPFFARFSTLPAHITACHRLGIKRSQDDCPKSLGQYLCSCNQHPKTQQQISCCSKGH